MWKRIFGSDGAGVWSPLQARSGEMKLKLKILINQNRSRVIPVICPDAGGARRIPTVFAFGN